MKLVKLAVAGFGRIADQTIDFGDGLTIVAGPNEAGKTTLAECVVRMLFGYPRRQYADDLSRYAPWNGRAYSATLSYRLDDGREFEIYRDFSKNDVPTQTVEADTRRPVPELCGNRLTSPGESALGFSLDVYRAAAMVSAGDVGTENPDDKTAHALADHLASAVGSGGDESAAGAIANLQRYMQGIGSTSPHTPLGKAAADEEELDAELRRYRADLEAFESTLQRRARLEDALHELSASRYRCAAALAAARRDGLSLRIERAEQCEAQLRAAQQRLHEIGAASSPVQPESRRTFDEAVERYRTAQRVQADAEARCAKALEERDARQRELDAANAELVERRIAVNRLDETIGRAQAAAEGRPSIDDESMADFERLADEADARESIRRKLETDAAIARQRPRPTPIPAFVLLVLAVGCAIVWSASHAFAWATAGGILAAAGIALAIVAFSGGSSRRKTVADAEALAEEAAASAEAAAASLAARCRRYGCADLSGVRAARSARSDLARAMGERDLAQAAAASALSVRDVVQRRLDEVQAAADEVKKARSDTIDRQRSLEALLAEAQIDLGAIDERIEAYRTAADAGAANANARAGVETAKAQLARVLAGSTRASLAEDRARLAADASAVADVGLYGGHGEADLDRELGVLDEKHREAQLALEACNGEIAGFQRTHATPLPDLEERADAARQERERIEASKAAARNAADVIAAVKDEVHRDFTPYLNEAVERAATAITGGRYAQAWVDPADFTLRVRSPETGASVERRLLSTGTIEQLQFALRAAAAGALGSGERVPLLYDDALAHADDDRLRAALTYAATLARDGAQIVFFTQRADVERFVTGLPGSALVRLPQP